MSMSRPQPQLQCQEGEGSFAQQFGSKKQVRIGTGNFQRRGSLVEDVRSKTIEVIAPFESKIPPNKMRQLALVAHNHMKPAMKEFIETYSEVLKKFRITGTQTTMALCKLLWGNDSSVEYGMTCTSGPLGGDAQIAALMCMEDLGCVIFFVDPLSSHPHQADIDSLLRLANCGNIIVCPNPTSASFMMHTLRTVLLEGDSARGMIPSFFETLESPAVTRYKHQQAAALANVIKGTPHSAPVPQAAELNKEKEEVMEEGESERPVSLNFKDDMKEAPLAFKQDVKRKTKRVTPRPRLSRSAIDRALLGESMVFGPDLQAMLSLELNGKDEEEDDDDASVEASASATAQVVDHVVMEQSRTLDYSGHPNPSMDLSLHPISVEEFDDEDNDSLEGEEDAVAVVAVAAPIAVTVANTGARVSRGLFGFKFFSSMSKGRLGVKNLRKKAARKFSLTLSGQEQERPSIVTATAAASGQSVMERKEPDLESEMLMLALKQQMELIEILKDRHNRQHS